MSLSSRRDALRLFGITGVAAVAAACSQPAAPAPTAVPAKPTAAPAAAPTSAPAPAPTAAAVAKPTAQQAPAQAQPASTQPADWDKVVEGAKKEGKLVIATYSGTAYRKIMDDFEKAYPGIKVEQTPFQSSSRDFFPRYFQERQAGLFLWDLMMVPATEPLVQAVPIGAIDPIRPLIVQPELLDDKNWLDGFEGGFLDTAKKWGYAVTASRSQSVWINTDMVKPDEVKGIKDLLDPKWKGKIMAGDLRTKGSGFWPGTVARIKTRGDDIIKQLWKDQEPTLSTDARQLTEQVVRGRFPIGIGAVNAQILIDFLAQGQGKNLKAIPMLELDYINSSSSVMHYANKAPNPNTAKLFVNWVLSKAGSTSYATNVQDNARRADVTPFSPDQVPEKGVDYVKIDAEQWVDEIVKTQKVATSVIG